ncbi:hypothetical protein GNP44_01990 [Aliivibrio fischeri]|uniref:hypothetical protein n=1 Tax=Aliivibrio fischeri TaxID=668 RepID=UPI0012D92EAB|nr:hypothetical protein [Aliivibrio fischeri]MUK28868.1 hypothetical protein [Aliivibrio fischeri]
MDFLLFFVPDTNEVIQVVFFSILTCILIGTLISLKINAREENWEKNWHGKLESGDTLLGSEHGSLQDMSSAVATKSEHACDVMPGFLLIIGLLGTFLGLGIALNQASTIINADLTDQNYDEMMNSLMLMMGGLGTKFKASIWGISGFLLIRLISSSFGIDSKRLFWCAEKMKEDTRLIKNKAELIESARLDKTLESFSLLGERLSISLERGFKENSEILQECMNSLAEINVCNNSILKEKDKMNKLLFNGFCVLNEIKDLNLSIGDKIEANSCDSNQLLNEISLNIVRNNNFDLLVNINSSLNHVADMTAESSAQMKAFSESSRDSLSSLSSSSQLMHEASQGINKGASNLSKTVDAFDLNMSRVMDKVSTDLDSTICEMSHTFTNSMSGMAKDMEHATSAIASAVKNNAESVEVTMNTVKDSIDESLSIQRKASLEFTSSSQTLNESIESITSLVSDLKESITSGLRAVSTSGKQVQSLNKRYSNITDVVEDLTNSIGESNDNILTKLELLISVLNESNNNKELFISSINSSHQRVISKLDGLVVAIDESKDKMDILNELKSIFSMLAEYNALMKSNSGSELNYKELKELNISLSDISNKISLLLEVNRNNEVIAA